MLQKRGWSLTKVAQLLSANPAALIGLGGRKGAIIQGFDADVIVWDPWATANTTMAGNYHKWKMTPYANMDLLGRVHMTFLDGVLVYSEEKGPYTLKLCGAALLIHSNGREHREQGAQG